METQFTVITERIDDVVLLLHVMKQMELPELLDKHLPRHWKQEGLDWGWVVVIWLAYILSEGDHRKVVVREWVNQQKTMIEQVCGLALRETDFTDDRLGIVLGKLSEPKIWEEIETALNRQPSAFISCRASVYVWMRPLFLGSIWSRREDCSSLVTAKMTPA
jgi:transposase